MNVSCLVAEGRDRFELRQTYTSTIWKGKKKAVLVVQRSTFGRMSLRGTLQGGVRGPKERRTRRSSGCQQWRRRWRWAEVAQALE